MINDIGRLALARRICTSGEARKRRLAAQLSLREVADACGVDPAAIQKWETGQRLPRRDAALRYLAVIEMISRVAA